MGRPRAFDWDAARRLYASGVGCTEIARRLGVSNAGIRRVVIPGERERVNAAGSQWQKDHRSWVGTCIDCGAPATKTFGYADRNGRCQACAAKAKATSVREDELRCGACGAWKPDKAFPLAAGKIARRGRHSVCSGCQARVRQAYREAHPEVERAANERRKQRRRQAALDARGTGC